MPPCFPTKYLEPLRDQEQNQEKDLQLVGSWLFHYEILTTLIDLIIKQFMCAFLH